jgi:hypothetical protein
MLAKKCPKCSAVWYTALPKCAFCGIEGVDVPTSTHTGRLPEKPAPAVQLEPEKKESATAVAEATPVPATSSDAAPPVTAQAEKTPVEPLPPPPAPATPAPAAEAPPAPKPALEALPVELQRPDPKTLPPAPQVPSARVPVVCGLLGLAAAALLPVATLVQLPRILAIVVTLVGGALLPFAPFAWWIGQRYEERCIDLKFRPASLGRAGRLLGTAVTFALALEGAAAAFLAAVVHLNAGK